MNKREIIERLKNIAEHAVHIVGEEPLVMSLDDGIAVHEAIELLKKSETNCSEFPNNSDTISRQQAIDALKTDMASLDHIIKGMSAYDVRLDAYVSQRNQVNFDIDTISNLPPAQPEQRWIPCSERLPEKEGWYITTVESEKTGKRRIENDLFAVDIALAHGHTPNKFCKDGYRQRTVAWMPFPEPYQRGEQE